jgi:hypothetical protein
MRCTGGADLYCQFVRSLDWRKELLKHTMLDLGVATTSGRKYRDGWPIRLINVTLACSPESFPQTTVIVLSFFWSTASGCEGPTAPL